MTPNEVDDFMDLAGPRKRPKLPPEKDPVKRIDPEAKRMADEINEMIRDGRVTPSEVSAIDERAWTVLQHVGNGKDVLDYEGEWVKNVYGALNCHSRYWTAVPETVPETSTLRDQAQKVISLHVAGKLVAGGTPTYEFNDSSLRSFISLATKILRNEQLNNSQRTWFMHKYLAVGISGKHSAMVLEQQQQALPVGYPAQTTITGRTPTQPQPQNVSPSLGCTHDSAKWESRSLMVWALFCPSCRMDLMQVPRREIEQNVGRDSLPQAAYLAQKKGEFFHRFRAQRQGQSQQIANLAELYRGHPDPETASTAHTVVDLMRQQAQAAASAPTPVQALLEQQKPDYVEMAKQVQVLIQSGERFAPRGDCANEDIKKETRELEHLAWRMRNTHASDGLKWDFKEKYRFHNIAQLFNDFLSAPGGNRRARDIISGIDQSERRRRG